MAHTYLKKKVQENLRCITEKEECKKTVWTKFNVMIEKSVSPTPSIENPGNGKMTRQLTKCTKTEYRW